MSAIPESRPDKNEKLRARMQRGAAQSLEPGETVACGVSNLAAPAWLHGAFGLMLLPYTVQKACVALITDRHVLVRKTDGFSQQRAWRGASFRRRWQPGHRMAAAPPPGDIHDAAHAPSDHHADHAVVGAAVAGSHESERPPEAGPREDPAGRRLHGPGERERSRLAHCRNRSHRLGEDHRHADDPTDECPVPPGAVDDRKRGPDQTDEEQPESSTDNADSRGADRGLSGAGLGRTIRRSCRMPARLGHTSTSRLVLRETARMSDVPGARRPSAVISRVSRDDSHPRLVGALLVVARGLLLPLSGALRLGLIDFRGCREFLSLMPGPSGRLLRRAWYSSTLAHCGARLTVHFGTILRDPRTRVGDDCTFGEHNSVGWADVGDHFVSGDHVSIVAGRHRQRFARTDIPMRFQTSRTRCVRIANDVWVGAHAVLAGDVSAHSIVGAGALIIEAFPEWSVLAGVPARAVGARR